VGVDHGGEAVTMGKAEEIRFEALKLAQQRAHSSATADLVVQQASVFAAFINRGASPLDDEDSAETEEPEP
jgi:hypothetical protein